MSRYLIVAHQTAESAELLEAVRSIVSRDSQARFVLLVPATPIDHLGVWIEGKAEKAAEMAGESAQKLWEAEGVAIDDVQIGDANPVYAVQDCLSEGDFDEVVVSTLPIGVSRWVKLDLVSKLRRSIDVPVTHVQG